MSPFFKYCDSEEIEYLTKERAHKEALKKADEILNKNIAN